MNAKIAQLLFKIQGLKKLLLDTDYMALKFVEGAFTVDEFEPIKTKRQGWRTEINALQLEIDELINPKKEGE